MANALTQDQQRDAKELAQFEAIIRDGLDTFVKVGCALEAIRDRELFKAAGFGTFDGYVQVKWKWSRRQANRQIAAAHTAKLLEAGDQLVPESESQVRELAGVPVEDVPVVWAEAVEDAGGEQPTAKQVRNRAAGRRERTPAQIARARERAAEKAAKLTAPPSGEEREAPETELTGSTGSDVCGVPTPEAGIDQPVPAAPEVSDSVEEVRESVTPAASKPNDGEPVVRDAVREGGAVSEEARLAADVFAAVADMPIRYAALNAPAPVLRRASLMLSSERIAELKATHRALGTFILQADIARENAAKAAEMVAA